MAASSGPPTPAQSPSHDRIRPAPGSPRGAFIASVIANRPLCTDHYRLVLRVEGFPSCTPGQFIQLDCRDSHAGSPRESNDAEPRSFEWPPASGTPRHHPEDPDFLFPLAYLRRPFSIGDYRPLPDGSAEIDVIHRIVGRGTFLLAKLQPGMTVSFIGPLGNGFHMPEDLKLACLVGGGVGVPPLFYLSRVLAARNFREAVAFIGAQRHDLLPINFTQGAPEACREGNPRLNVHEFAQFGFTTAISTDDGSAGLKGFVTHALRRFLEARRAQSGSLAGTIIYCCGPTPMMKSTAKVAAEFGVPCQVSLEQPMACGMGTCQSCVIRYRPHTAPPETDWKYRLTCTDGPVFDSRDILW